MPCNFCEKIDGLERVDHPLNGAKTVGFGTTKNVQVYRCQMCQEYVVHIIKSTASLITSPAGDEKIKHVGWDPDKIEEPED